MATMASASRTAVRCRRDDPVSTFASVLRRNHEHGPAPLRLPHFTPICLGRAAERFMTSLALKVAKLDIERSAQTILPIELQGRALQLEAFAYQGADPAYQALALLHRNGEVAGHDVT